MHLTSLHNSDIRLDRSDNKGIFTARYETADELADLPIEVGPPLADYDVSDVPSVLNFLPPDTFRGILQQAQPAMSTSALHFRYSIFGRHVRTWFVVVRQLCSWLIHLLQQ